MLKSLYVKNFALLNNIEVEFQPGLNIITGETGAGKSILINALGSTLGEKVDGDVLRTGSDKAIVEGTFQLNINNNEVKKCLQDNDIDDFDSTVILRKEVANTGRNRAFINDTPTTVSTLTNLGDLLVDLHGQHEHQALLKVKYHLQYLDNYGQYFDLLEKVKESYLKIISLINNLKELKEKEKYLSEKKDLLQQQLKEIVSVDPQIGEDEKLLNEEKIITNSEKLFQLTKHLYNKLYETNESAYEIISDAFSKLEELSQIDNNFAEYKNDCQSAKIAIEEISKFIQSYNSNVEFNPERLDEIRERLTQFSNLRKKFGSNIEEILNYKLNIEDELQLIENLDESIVVKQQQIDQEKIIFSNLCVDLSKKRKETARVLEKIVESTLNELGMGLAKFHIRNENIQDNEGLVTIDDVTYKAAITGIDNIEFFISANPGEDLKPLAKIASGGEISRIMLSLKTALAEADKIPVLIFDEIDSGVSGRIAQAVGKSLKKLSQSHQIICITHLPQIASLGDHHFVVEKFAENNLTYTKIKKLEESEKAIEIAKLLGGETVTESHIKSAQELIDQGKNY